MVLTAWLMTRPFAPVAACHENRDSLYHCRYSADGRSLIYRLLAAVVVREAEMLKEVCRIPLPGRVTAFDMDAAGQFFCVGSELGAEFLLRVENLEPGRRGGDGFTAIRSTTTPVFAESCRS